MHVSEEFAKVLRRTAGAALVVLAVFLISQFINPPRVGAQNAGTVGIQAQLIPVFANAQSTNACSPILNDEGQGQNTLFLVTSSFTGTIDLEWTPPPINPSSTYYPLVRGTYVSDTSSSHQLFVGAYYPNLRSCASNVSHGSILAWYSSIAGPISPASPAIGSFGPTSLPICDQNQTFTFTSSSLNALSVSPLNAGDTVVICGFTIGFSAAATSGTVGVDFFSVSNCTGTETVTWVEPTTSSTAQMFTILLPLRSVGSNIYACFNNTSTTGGTISLAWASVHL